MPVFDPCAIKVSCESDKIAHVLTYQGCKKTDCQATSKLSLAGANPCLGIDKYNNEIEYSCK